MLMTNCTLNLWIPLPKIMSRRVLLSMDHFQELPMVMPVIETHQVEILLRPDHQEVIDDLTCAR
jgi:hypothetical protein